MINIQTHEQKLKSKLNELDYNSLTWEELAIQIGCSSKTIRKWFKDYNISKDKVKPVQNSISPNGEIESLVEQGFKSSEIAEKLNLTIRQVTTYRHHNKIGADTLGVRRTSKLELTNIEKQVIYGSMLGDGYIEDDKLGYCRIVIKHGEKQKDYVYYKHNLLKRFSNDITQYERKDNRLKFKDHIEIGFKTTTNEIFEEYKKLYYNEFRNRIVCKEHLYQLNGLGWAIWIMDDGYWDSDSISLSTHRYSDNDRNIIIEYMNSINIKATIQSSGVIHISKHCVNELIENVKPYFVKDLLYKLNKSE